MVTDPPPATKSSPAVAVSSTVEKSTVTASPSIAERETRGSTVAVVPEAFSTTERIGSMLTVGSRSSLRIVTVAVGTAMVGCGPFVWTVTFDNVIENDSSFSYRSSPNTSTWKVLLTVSGWNVRVAFEIGT